MTLLERIQAAKARRYPEWVQRMLEGRLPAQGIYVDSTVGSMSKGKPGFHVPDAHKSHPRRQARRDRAAERAALHVCGPTCKKNRKAVS